MNAIGFAIRKNGSIDVKTVSPTSGPPRSIG
jgi:hypothetical protein